MCSVCSTKGSDVDVAVLQRIFTSRRLRTAAEFTFYQTSNHKKKKKESCH